MYVYVTLHYIYYFAGNTCPPLSDPTNGKVFQLTDRNAAVFSCDDGYIKNGESYLRCVNGNWSSSPPTCLKSP